MSRREVSAASDTATVVERPQAGGGPGDDAGETSAEAKKAKDLRGEAADN